jgi:predicted SprT family Zn-dependent metalloprotease
MADLRTASTTATALLKEHGLYQKGWRFAWNSNKTRNGVCKYGTKRIEASKVLSGIRTDEQVRQTLLHEVAHALVGPAHAHDRVWLAKARSIGYKGSARTNEAATREALATVSRYVGLCDRCDLRWPRHKIGRIPLGVAAYRCKCGGKIAIHVNTPVSA